ncbi:MAG: terminase [bacterium]|nr:terminase [bacterium]
MLLSDKYWDYIDSEARAEFLEGTTAAGKTTTVGVKFIMNVAESDMTLHVIAAKTTGVAEKNIINSDFGLMQIFPNLQYCGNGDKDNKLPHIKLFTDNGTKIIYVLGYDNKDKWKNALGSQFGCVWVDECNTADMDFIREIFGRSKYFVGTLNPDDPSLPVYDEYVNRSRPLSKYARDVPNEIMDYLEKCEAQMNWDYWFFSFEDNISMSPEQIIEKKLSYPKGTKIYKNKVLGLRGRATGLVFVNFSRKRHVRSKEWAKQFIKKSRNQEEYFEYFTSGMDTAYSSNSPDTISMVFHGITNKGKCVQLDEKVYNNRDIETPIAPSDTVVNYIDFLERNRKEWGFARQVFVDSADQATLTELAKYKREHPECQYIFNNAHKKVMIIDRINLQLGWLSYDDEYGKEPCFYVLEHCTNTIQEYEVYSWDEKKDNTPEDRNDHCVNAGQYSWIPYRDKIGTKKG